MDELISIIVPVYNVQTYLEQCVESLLNQTYSNLEILLIDDGSTDQSGAICEKFAKKDARIHVVHQKNSGLSAARNKGTELAQGKYIAYVDSDDYVTNDYIEVLYSLIKEYGAQISVCRFRYVYGSKEDNIDGKCDTFVYDKITALKVLLSESEFGHYSHQKLFEKSIVRKHPFPDGKIYEDIATTYLYFHEAEKVAYSQKQLYFYRQRAGSIIAGAYAAKNKFDILNTLNEMQHFFDKNYPMLSGYVLIPKMFYYLHAWARLPNDKTIFFQERERIVLFIKNNRIEALKFKEMPVSTKKKVMLSFLGEKTYKMIWKLQKCAISNKIK